LRTPVRWNDKEAKILQGGEANMQHQPVVSTRPSHRIGILISAAGRYLVCSACQLSFEFPSGVPSLTITKQFESQFCGGAPILSKAPHPHIARVRSFAEKERASLAAKTDTSDSRN
jgi:hypothetical protein